MAYVGIVLVSHSAALAAGARDLLAQVAGPDVRVEPAGGTDDGGLGTSAAKIEAAVARAGTGAGVLVLADLGSAVLTTRAVLDDLADLAPPDSVPPGSLPPDSVPPDSVPPDSVPPDSVPPDSVRQGSVLLVDAPFVEGAVAAAVTASTGADLPAVAAAAREARDVPKF
jgi:PTS hybrid protein